MKAVWWWIVFPDLSLNAVLSNLSFVTRFLRSVSFWTQLLSNAMRMRGRAVASRFFSELSTLNSFLEQNRLLNRFFLQLSYFNSFAIFSDNFTKPESNLTIFL